jgi:hypothetical protein
MANEAVIIELLGNGGDPVRYTCANGTGIAKGTLLQLADPRTASATSADGDKFIGIAAHEKVANDGSTSIAVYTNGIFGLKDSGGGVNAGTRVKVNGANLIATADEAGANGESEVVGLVLTNAGAGGTAVVRVLK